MPKTLLLSGFELQTPQLPESTRMLLPPMPLPELEPFADAVARALDEPLSGPPLSAQVRSSSAVTIALDDLTFPLPPATRDCRREMLEVVLRLLAQLGVQSELIRIVVLDGLSRKWRQAELEEWLGPAATGLYGVSCHDAEEGLELARMGDEPEGPVYFNRALAEADLIIHLNVVATPQMAGLSPLAVGGTGYRTSRMLFTPAAIEEEVAPFRPGSRFQQRQEQVASHLARAVPIFQLSAVLNNELWTPAIAAMLHSGSVGARPLQMWNALPDAVRQRAGRIFRASYRPISLFSGPPDVVAPRALEVFLRQHEVATADQADILVFGLPDAGPYSIRTAQNPVLAAHLAIGMAANLFTDRPLLREGGVIIFAHPLTPSFDRRAHRPHEEFYEKVLRNEREPEAIQERYEPYFAGRPEFVSNYQRRFAFHGTHPLHVWYQCSPVRRYAQKIIVAHGDPRACARLGFSHAVDVEDALNKARDLVDSDNIVLMDVPPPFWVRVRPD